VTGMCRGAGIRSIAATTNGLRHRVGVLDLQDL
jgi:hypothetical protein